ncbi:GFA family protein [Pseudoalteromonas sp. SMS1]|uniref:GFA family protein n=1 Tax=Pseudoalteromonas sp. SMS1 TaxID=2908894 RepID=UPI003FA6D4C5
MIKGSCLCAAIEFTLLSQPKAITACHCRMCQKQHGAAFAVYGSVLITQLSINKGAQLLVSYNSSGTVQRQFCQKCGSSLFWSGSEHYSDWVSVALTALDEPYEVKKVKHIHRESRVCWLE